MTITNCACCGKEIQSQYKPKKYCSNECRYKSVKRPAGVKRERYKLICKYCNEEFIDTNPNSNYCSVEHKRKHFEELLKEKPCKTCGSIFKPKRREQRYCSIKCSKPRKNEYFDCICEKCNNHFEARYAEDKICYDCRSKIKIESRKCAKWHGHWCEYNRIKVMSTYKLRTCNVLDKMVLHGLIDKWEYTKDKIKYIGIDNKKHNYLLDFKIYKNNTFSYLGVKGVKRANDDLKWQAVINNGYDLDIWFLSDIELKENNLNISKDEIKTLLETSIINKKEVR